MSPRILRMTAREVERILARHGFELVSQRGSHRKWRHPAERLQVIVPAHQGKQLPLGTLRTILVNAKIPETDWQRQKDAEFAAPGATSNRHWPTDAATRSLRVRLRESASDFVRFGRIRPCQSA